MDQFSMDQYASLHTDTYQNSPIHAKIHHCILIHTKGQKNMPKYAHDIVARNGTYEQFIRTKCIHIVYQLLTHKLFRYGYWYILLPKTRRSSEVIFCKVLARKWHVYKIYVPLTCQYLPKYDLA